MFFIRDAKGNETGPFPAETIKQWLRERRYNCFTTARRTDEEKWKMLGSFTDFSGVRPEPGAQGHSGPVTSPGSPSFITPSEASQPDTHAISENAPPPLLSAKSTEATTPPWLMKTSPSPDNTKPAGSTQSPFPANSPPQKSPIAPPPPPAILPDISGPDPASLRYSLPLWAKIVWGIILGMFGLAFLGSLVLSMISGNFSSLGSMLFLILIMLAVSYGLSLGCWKLFNRSKGAAAAGLFTGAIIIFGAFFVIPFLSGVSRGIKEAKNRAETQKQEARVDSALTAATDVVSRKISLKATAYYDARENLDFSSMVNLAGILKKDDLVARRNRLNTLLEKKNQLEQIWSNAAALMREELEKQKLSPEEIDAQIADFNSQFNATKQETARQLEKDGQLIFSLIEMHQLLESEWGRWQIKGNNIMFENTAAMQKYNSIMKAISASSL